MSTESNEQYRAGFEADKLQTCPFCGGAARIQSNRDWHRLFAAHDEDCIFDADEENLMYPATDKHRAQLVEDWNRRPKREASTEPSSLVESLRAALRSVNAVAIDRGDKYGACDQVDNHGQPYQSQWFADLLADQSAGALTDDAIPEQDQAHVTPLTDPEIDSMWHTACVQRRDIDYTGIPTFVRAIEAEVAARFRAAGRNTQANISTDDAKDAARRQTGERIISALEAMIPAVRGEETAKFLRDLVAEWRGTGDAK